jgi:hypothetical protein
MTHNLMYRVSSVISKMGFVMSEMGFPKIVVPVAISCSVACSAVGFVYQVCSSLLEILLPTSLFALRRCALLVCTMGLDTSWRCVSLLQLRTLA